MAGGGESVVHLLDESQLSDPMEDVLFVLAQKKALNEGLPFAVIARIEAIKPSLRDVLHELEQRLSGFNIPLIVMVGGLEKVTVSINVHLKPIAIYTIQRDDSSIKKSHLVDHIFDWPGVVIPVLDVFDGDISC